MVEVQLAADLGYSIPWLVQILTIAIIVATGFFVYVALSTIKSKNTAALQGFDRLKYQLHKYHAERYWAIAVAGVLVWFWVLGYPWMPPVAFSNAIENPEEVHTVRITAGQWFWILEDGGYGGSGPAYSQPITAAVDQQQQVGDTSSSSTSDDTAAGIQANDGTSQGDEELRVKAGETVKFVARSLDVNHGFAILSSSESMDTPLMQMQVIPGYDNVFYFTFDKPGTYTIRCLEYCGWNHPFMVSQITIHAA